MANSIIAIHDSNCARVTQVKGLFKELNVDFKLFELDQMGEDELTLQLWRVLLFAPNT